MIYDPIFTEPDIMLLREAGLNLIDPDEVSTFVLYFESLLTSL